MISEGRSFYYSVASGEWVVGQERAGIYCSHDKPCVPLGLFNHVRMLRG